jgi:hypothetical protein
MSDDIRRAAVEAAAAVLTRHVAHGITKDAWRKAEAAIAAYERVMQASRPRSPLARAICCEGQPCIRPDSCDAGKPWRVPISPTRAAAAVERLLCERWAQTRACGGSEGAPEGFDGAPGSCGGPDPAPPSTATPDGFTTGSTE